MTYKPPTLPLGELRVSKRGKRAAEKGAGRSLTVKAICFACAGCPPGTYCPRCQQTVNPQPSDTKGSKT